MVLVAVASTDPLSEAECFTGDTSLGCAQPMAETTTRSWELVDSSAHSLTADVTNEPALWSERAPAVNTIRIDIRCAKATLRAEDCTGVS